MKKKILSVFLSLALCLSVIPETVYAEENGTTENTENTENGSQTQSGAHTHCVCGATHQSIGDHTQEEVITWTAVAPATGEETISKAQLEAVTQAADGYYYLTADVELKGDETYEPCDPNGMGAKNVTLCLNGHSISQTKERQMNEAISTDVITGTSGQTLTLTDCQETQGEIKHTADLADVYGKGIYWAYDSAATEKGKLILYGGCITNNLCGVNVEPGASVVMYGGSVTGNGVGDGGGMLLNGDFTMYGGSITGNNMSGVRVINSSGQRVYRIGGTAVISGNTDNGKAVNFVPYHDYEEELCGVLEILDGFSGTVSLSVKGTDIGKQVVRYPADDSGTGTVKTDSELYEIDQSGKVKSNCTHAREDIIVNVGDIYCKICGTRMTVSVYTEGTEEEEEAEQGDTEYYAELSAALANVGIGSQVSLLDDTVMESDAEIRYPFELYLEEYTLSMKPQAEGEAGQGTEAASKTLTIYVDSGKTVSIVGRQGGRIDGSIALESGELNLYGAPVDTVAVSDGKLTTDGDSSVGTLTVSDGEVTLNGETEKVTVSGGEVELNNISPQTVTVTGGEVELLDGGAETVAVSGGEVTLNGNAGTVTVTDGGMTMDHGSIGELTVSGGGVSMADGDVHTFTVTGGSAAMTGGSIANDDEDPVLTVSGGSFSMSGGYVQQLTQSGTGAVQLSGNESANGCYLGGITAEKTIAELLSTGVAVRRGSGGWLTAEELQVKSLEDDNFFIQNAPLQNLTLTAADGSAVPGSIEYAAPLTLTASAKDAEGNPVTDEITYEWAADGETPEDDAEYVFSGAEEFNRRDVKVKQGATAAEDAEQDAEQPYRVTCYLTVWTDYGDYTAGVSREITVTQKDLKDAELQIWSENPYTAEYGSEGGTFSTISSGLSVSLPLADGITADLTDGIDFEPDPSSDLSGTEAGTYTLKIKAVRGGNYKGEASTDWKILPKEITKDSGNFLVEGGPFKYTGSAVTPKITVTDAGGNAIPETEYTVSYADNVNAGMATATITDQPGGNYEVSGTVTFLIGKAVPEGLAVSMADYTYGDTPSVPTVTGNSGNGAVIYYYGTENVSEGGTEWENMTGTTLAPGTYYLYAVIAETENYADTATKPVAFCVRKASSVAAAVSMADYTYGGTPSVPTVTGNAGNGAVTYYYGTANVSEGGTKWENMTGTTLAAGTYYLYAVIEETENYAETVTEPVAFCVGKVPVTSAAVSMADYTYGGTPSVPTVTGNSGNGAVTYYYGTANVNENGTKWENMTGTTLAAGTYYLYAVIEETENYAGAVTACVSFQVGKASSASATVSMADYTYGGTPSVPTITGNSGNGAVTYYYGTENVSEGGTKWENMTGTTLAPGTYYLYAVIEETENYAETVTEPVAFCVREAESGDAGTGDSGSTGSGDAGTGEGGNAGTGESGSAGSGDAGTGESGSAGSGDAGTGESGNAGSGDAGTGESGNAGSVSGNGSGNDSGNAGNGSTGNDSGSSDAGTGSGNAGNDGGSNNAGSGLNVNGGTTASASQDWQNVDTFLQGLVQSVMSSITAFVEGQTENGADGTDTESGVNVNVRVSGETGVPVNVLQTISGTTLTLAMQQGNGVALSISGGALNEDNLSGVQTIDLTTDPDAAAIPEELTQERETENSRQLAIRDTGRFAVPVGLHVGMGEENAGRYANFYRYNEAENRLEYCGSFRITENGQAMLTLQQGGSYFVNVTDEIPQERYHFQAAFGNYTVQRGDSLSKIARRFRMSLAELLKKNPDLADPNSIRAGQRINVD